LGGTVQRKGWETRRAWERVAQAERVERNARVRREREEVRSFYMHACLVAAFVCFAAVIASDIFGIINLSEAMYSPSL
jgi:hypothetical protein